MKRVVYKLFQIDTKRLKIEIASKSLQNWVLRRAPQNSKSIPSTLVVDELSFEILKRLAASKYKAPRRGSNNQMIIDFRIETTRGIGSILRSLR